MVLSMSRPYKHPKTGVYWFRKAVPEALRPLVGKGMVIRTLGTKDPAEARRLFAEVAAEVARHWLALKSPAATLSHKQIIALAGMFYTDLTSHLSDEPGTVGTWQHWLRLDSEARAAGRLEQWYGASVDELLRKEGLNIDASTRSRLLEAISDASRLAAEQLKRNTKGDYSPDPAAARFPAWQTSRPAPAAVSADQRKTTMTGILQDWWKEAKATGRKPSTFESYSHTVNSFIALLKHDDAGRVTPEDVVAFKDHRLASINPRNGKPLSPKTVKDSDLSALKTLFGWALTNRRLSSNPATGITIKLGKKPSVRPKGFTAAEAKALLEAADRRTQGNDRPKTFAAKRWVPWLCAYTGARVGEMAQLRKEDVREEEGHWVIRITPEAGTVKTNEARDVVLHEHLIAKGFPAFVEGCKDGPLFLKPSKDGDVLGPLQGLKNRLAAAARETVDDPRVMPSHGWRHRFKTEARSSGLDSRTVDAMQGHAPRTAGDDYGDITIAALALTIAKFPRQS